MNRSIYALRALLNSLAHVIGAEAELGGKAVSPGWADVSEEKLDDWKKKGLELRGELESVVQGVMSAEYGRLMRKVCSRPFFRPLGLIRTGKILVLFLFYSGLRYVVQYSLTSRSISSLCSISWKPTG